MSKTILVVDDSPSLRHVVTITLTGAGYDVIEGCDGRDALTMLDGRKISLIISDVNMPHLDGLRFAEEVRKIPSYRFTPIMMLTTETSQDKKDVARAAGAKAWLPKPFHPEQMLAAVSKLVLP